MNVANKYLVAGGILGGLVLVIIAYSTLYQSDYRALLVNNPDKIAILIDYNASNRLEIITRGREWAFNQEVLRIRYNEQETTLYSNSNILARSQWRVESKGGKIGRASCRERV